MSDKSYKMKNLKIKIPAQTLVDQVEEKLLDYFRLNKLKPGDSLPNENELSVALGVARSVLREALSRLRMLGLIEARTRRGMILTEPHILGGLQRVLEPEILGEETLFNLLGFRITIELGICNRIFDNLNNRHIEELEEIVHRGVVYENNLYMPSSEHQFHSKLYEITGNDIIIQFQEIIYPVSLFVKSKFKDFFEPVNRELKQNGQIITHKDLFGFIRRRDKEGFREALEQHFTPYNRFIEFNDSSLKSQDE